MTDIIGSLADSIVVLNNASPRLPTKQQIEEVLRPLLEKWLPMPGFVATAPGMFVREVRVPPGQNVQDTIMPLPYKDPSPELMELVERNTKALKDAMNTTVYGGPTVEDREKFWAKKLNEPFYKSGRLCPGSTDGSHAWYCSGTPPEMRTFCLSCGATKP